MTIGGYLMDLQNYVEYAAFLRKYYSYIKYSENPIAFPPNRTTRSSL